MRFMLIVKSTVLNTTGELTAFLVNSALLILVYNLYLDRVIIFYPLLLSGTVLLVYLIVKGNTLMNFYKRLGHAQSPAPEYSHDNDLQAQVFKTISDIHQKYLNQITRLQLQMNTRNTIFTQFIHGLKSSVSVIGLVCDKYNCDDRSDTPLSDVHAENEKLKKNLEQALNLLRLDTFANDYIPERVDLATIVTHTINEHKRDFIYAGIFPKLNGSACVHTDSKWCGFLISQLISNAIKYSKPGNPVIFDVEKAGERIELRISDSGAGIPSEDLPRVFDMFFTGINGRQRTDSTGIGLFMCKHIADRLGIALSIDSEFAKGTTVTLAFKNLTKL